MIEREISAVFKKAVKSHPVVTVFGPRQSGKTTLVRHVLPKYGYVNLENPKERRLASEDPESFFEQHPSPLIIDEVQRVPELLSWIQVRVDESGKKGEYVLTGSHQPPLKEKVFQSLAGRTALITLLPFSLSELVAAGYSLSRDEAIYRGSCRGFMLTDWIRRRRTRSTIGHTSNAMCVSSFRSRIRRPLKLSCVFWPDGSDRSSTSSRFLAM